jgi:predicted molibdopterin-dependent oxidoreductase YjgC
MTMTDLQQAIADVRSFAQWYEKYCGFLGDYTPEVIETVLRAASAYAAEHEDAERFRALVPWFDAQDGRSIWWGMGLIAEDENGTEIARGSNLVALTDALRQQEAETHTPCGTAAGGREDGNQAAGS